MFSPTAIQSEFAARVAGGDAREVFLQLDPPKRNPLSIGRGIPSVVRWNSKDARFGGIAITRQDVLLAAHTGDFTGADLSFISMADQEIVARVDRQASILGTDIAIAKLAEPLPASIPPAGFPIDRYTTSPGLPVIWISQDEQAAVLETAWGGSSFGLRNPADPRWSRLSAIPRGFDSGSPAILIAQGQPIVLGLLSWISFGPAVTGGADLYAYRDRIAELCEGRPFARPAFRPSIRTPIPNPSR